MSRIGLRDRLVDPLHRMPLRLRLVAVMVGLLIAALTGAGFAASYRLSDFLIAQKSDELRAAAPEVANAAYRDLLNLGQSSSSFPRNSYSVTVMVDGEKTTTQDPGQPNVPGLARGDRRVTTGKPFIVPSNDGRSRWLVTAMDGPSETTTTAVAISMSSADQTVTRMRWFIVFISLVAALACALLGWFAIRRAFRPLNQIEDTAKSIAEGNMASRVPAIATHDEVSSLAHSLNVMLTRIEGSFAVREASEERMRQFVADASHELRTPLATVRGYAELFRQGAVARPDDVAAAMRRIEDEATRMGVLVDDLLLLTRLERREHDPSEQRRQLAPVDLTVLAADAVQDARALDHDRTIRLVGLHGALSPTVVHGDESRLRQVLTNLLANAIRYTPDRTPLEIVVGVDGDSAELRVCDHGPGVPPDQRGRIFERFYRADLSRNSSSGGSGLGLAIVAAIIEAHHGRVHITETPGGGATFIVRIPQPTHRSGLAAVQYNQID